MELNVMIPSHPPLDFLSMNNTNNTSTCSSPYISAPSSPQKQLNFFYSAPSSPTKFSSISDRFSGHGVPFDWEYKPGVPKSPSRIEEDVEQVQDNEFEFEFSGQLDKMVRPSLSSADELFDCGKIRPLKPPPVVISTVDNHDHQHSPRSPMSKFKDALSPKHRRSKNSHSIDPFESAIKATTNSELDNPYSYSEQARGRSKNITNTRANSRKGISRSLSPLRVSEFALHQQELLRESYDQSNQISSNNSTTSSRWGSRKWRLKDFLLFRSASEGSATTNGKDPLKNKKYLSNISSKKSADDTEGSFRSNDGSVSRRRGTQVSAHERHYMKNRLVSEEQKKKTSLPYKPGLLACLGFNPALHDISKAFGSFNHL